MARSTAAANAQVRPSKWHEEWSLRCPLCGWMSSLSSGVASDTAGDTEGADHSTLQLAGSTRSVTHHSDATRELVAYHEHLESRHAVHAPAIGTLHRLGLVRAFVIEYDRRRKSQNEVIDVDEIVAHVKRHRLNELLRLQHLERIDQSFSFKCLFCSFRVDGCNSRGRSELLAHMFETHQFNVGLPDNIVLVEELLSTMQEMLDRRTCLYCEKVFKDHSVLRLHMRKKKHFRVHPRNTLFDKFYLVNYTGALRPAAQRTGSSTSGSDCGEDSFDADDDDDDDDDGDDDEEDDGGQRSWGVRNSDRDWPSGTSEEEWTCLFCDAVDRGCGAFEQHARSHHGVDLAEVIRRIDVYQCIKLVNYIRSNTAASTCWVCGEEFTSSAALYSHTREFGHHVISAQELDKLDDSFLIPACPNDPALQIVLDMSLALDSGDGEEGAGGTEGTRFATE